MRFMRADLCAPLALNAVKREQVSCGGCTALEFIEVNHIQSVGLAGIVRRSKRCAHGGPQCQTPDPSHAVDANFVRSHPPPSPQATVRPLSPAAAYRGRCV